jgi:hypothetical protein
MRERKSILALKQEKVPGKVSARYVVGLAGELAMKESGYAWILEARKKIRRKRANKGALVLLHRPHQGSAVGSNAILGEVVP